MSENSKKEKLRLKPERELELRPYCAAMQKYQKLLQSGAKAAERSAAFEELTKLQQTLGVRGSEENWVYEQLEEAHESTAPDSQNGQQNA